MSSRDRAGSSSNSQDLPSVLGGQLVEGAATYPDHATMPGSRPEPRQQWVADATRSNQSIHAAVLTHATSPENFTLINDRKVSLALRKGHEGFVLSFTDRDTTGRDWRKFVLARSDSKEIKGWVRNDALKIGQAAGKIKVIDMGKMPLPQVTNLTGTSVLERTIIMLLQAFSTDRDAFIADRASPRGMPPKMKRACENGRPRFDDLWNLPCDGKHDVIGASDKRTIIYFLAFQKLSGAIFANDKNANGKYGGKIVNASQRKDAHNQALNNETQKSGHMYSRARGAEDSRMLVVTDVSGVAASMREDVAQVAEQVTVCLLGTITAVLLGSDAFKTIGSATKYYFDYLAAQRFNDIAKKVFAITSWTPPKGAGLNWRSPMMETILEHTAWTCQEVPLDDRSSVKVFRRSPVATNFKHEQKTGTTRATMRLFSGGDNMRGAVYLTVPDSVPDNTKVTPVIEIYQGQNVRHPFSFANCPEPGPWSDWGLQNRIGIRFEWRDTNDDLITEWVEAKGNHFATLGWPDDKAAKAGPGYAHVSELYVKVQLIYNTLMQAEYELGNGEKLPDWTKQGPPISVKEFKYDHLKQELRIVDQIPTKLRVPTLVDFWKNAVMMGRMYGPNLMLGELGRPQEGLFKSPWQATTQCCICVQIQQKLAHRVNTATAADKGECIKRANSDSKGRLDSCKPCFFLRRPCAWVPLVDLETIGGLYQYIRCPHRHEIEPHKISGPSIEGATVEELEEAEEN